MTREQLYRRLDEEFQTAVDAVVATCASESVRLGLTDEQAERALELQLAIMFQQRQADRAAIAAMPATETH
jgi:hypothetical protein